MAEAFPWAAIQRLGHGTVADSVRPRSARHALFGLFGRGAASITPRLGATRDVHHDAGPWRQLTAPLLLPSRVDGVPAERSRRGGSAVAGCSTVMAQPRSSGSPYQSGVAVCGSIARPVRQFSQCAQDAKPWPQPPVHRTGGSSPAGRRSPPEYAPPARRWHRQGRRSRPDVASLSACRGGPSAAAAVRHYHDDHHDRHVHCESYTDDNPWLFSLSRLRVRAEGAPASVGVSVG